MKLSETIQINIPFLTCEACYGSGLVAADRQDVIHYLVVLRYGIKGKSIRECRQVIRQWRADGRKLPCHICNKTPLPGGNVPPVKPKTKGVQMGIKLAVGLILLLTLLLGIYLSWDTGLSKTYTPWADDKVRIEAEKEISQQQLIPNLR